VEGGGGGIEVGPSTTLAGLRQAIIDEFDEDQLPGGVKDGSTEFYFEVGGVRVSTGQERTKRPYDGIESVTIRKKPRAAGGAAPTPVQMAAPPPPAADAAADGRRGELEASPKRQKAEAPAPAPAAPPPRSPEEDEPEEEEEEAGPSGAAGAAMDVDSDDESSDDYVEEVAPPDEPAAGELRDAGPDPIHEASLALSRDVLGKLRTMVDAAPLLAADDRRGQWAKTIAETEKKGIPNTVVGVLGGTGVGKSSLLNALLGEASILPTSGSRGCTAAVVELQFNSNLSAREAEGASEETAVYVGAVEFMRLPDWCRELGQLVSECCTQEGFLYARKPDPTRDETGHAAWEKIEQACPGVGSHLLLRVLVAHEAVPLDGHHRVDISTAFDRCTGKGASTASTPWAPRPLQSRGTWCLRRSRRTGACASCSRRARRARSTTCTRSRRGASRAARPTRSSSRVAAPTASCRSGGASGRAPSALGSTTTSTARATARSRSRGR